MFEGNFYSALLLTTIAGISTGIGSVIVMFSKKFNPKILAVSMGFSAGVMIFISLAELFTEAKASLSEIYGSRQGLLYTLLAFFTGMAVIAIIDYLVPEKENPHEMHKNSLPSDEDKEEMAKSAKLMRVGIVSTLVIAIHNFPEGIATFVSAMDNSEIGLSIAFAVGIHNIPEGIAVAIPIFYATKKKWKAICYSTLSGLAEPIGGIIGYFILSRIFEHSFMGLILAFVAGIMIYISLDELLPTAETYGEHHIAIRGVIAGMAFIGFGFLLFA